MRDENGRHITGTLPEDEAEAAEISASRRARGLGDTVAKLAHAVGADKAAEAFTRLTGKDCGCNARRDALNRLVPYGKP